MTKLNLFRLGIVSALLPFLAVFTIAQDFQKSYSLGPEGSISIHNVSGDIRVTVTTERGSR